jgi:FKBP-type peptidyl-prolyl cis-trans isomerase
VKLTGVGLLLLLGCSGAAAPTHGPNAGDALQGAASGKASQGAASPAATAESAPTASAAGGAPHAVPPASSLEAPSDVGGPPPDAQLLASGLASVVLHPGTGSVKPTVDDRVVVHFTGWTGAGELFDNSLDLEKPPEFLVQELSPAWREGLQLMTAGEKRRFWIPAHLSYSGQLRSGSPDEHVVYDIELLEVIRVTPQPPPADVKRPPSKAKRTKSGLAYLVLEKGTGTEHPHADMTLSVEYTGWTSDGKMFDSSLSRGEPFLFRLEQVIDGWREALPLMVVGERTRFWIPAKLAYGDHPTQARAPAGMLVFDIRLLEIIPNP